MTSRRAVLGGLLAMLAAVRSRPGAAQDTAQGAPDARLVAAAERVALAHVLTTDSAVDEATAAGLAGLSTALAARTTVEPGPPVAVDLDRDDLSLLTLLYWPVTDTQPLPGIEAWARLNRFIATGGVILFDTRDGDIAGTGAPESSPALRALAAPLEIPPLAPMPDDHVLTRSFYLLDGLPGRYAGTPVWVERSLPALPGIEGGAVNDGVSPVVIGGNAWAEAWAVDDLGHPLFTVGRGLAGLRQREMALRAGINLVMYVLTGNYKADQVHVPDLLERLARRHGETGEAGGEGPGPLLDPDLLDLDHLLGPAIGDPVR